MMAEATSPTTGHRYGVARVCRLWEVPRSSFYTARQVGADGANTTASPARRGPKPAVSDQDLLAAIRADLARSPWTGEGHRKVWARLRALDGMRVSRKRVLRLMREQHLLSPHRVRPRPETTHERRIITAAPNVMWAIDATQVATVRDGKVWLFGVVEHWNAEMLGWHVAKHGTRYEAVQALGMAVRQQFGSLSAGAARGLALRHDHGSNSHGSLYCQQPDQHLIARSPAAVPKRRPGSSPSASWHSPARTNSHSVGARSSRTSIPHTADRAQAGETILQRRLSKPCCCQVHPPGSVRT